MVRGSEQERQNQNQNLAEKENQDDSRAAARLPLVGDGHYPWIRAGKQNRNQNLAKKEKTKTTHGPPSASRWSATGTIHGSEQEKQNRNQNLAKKEKPRRSCRRSRSRWSAAKSPEIPRERGPGGRSLPGSLA
jgi:hypothetical protein